MKNIILFHFCQLDAGDDRDHGGFADQGGDDERTGNASSKQTRNHRMQVF